VGHNSDPSFSDVIEEHCPGDLCGFRSIRSKVSVVSRLLLAFLILDIDMRVLTVPHAEEQTGSRCVEISVLEGARRHPLASSARFRKPYPTYQLWSDTSHS